MSVSSTSGYVRRSLESEVKVDGPLIKKHVKQEECQTRLRRRGRAGVQSAPLE